MTLKNIFENIILVVITSLIMLMVFNTWEYEYEIREQQIRSELAIQD